MAYTVYLCSVGKTAVHLGIVLELFIKMKSQMEKYVNTYQCALVQL